MCNFCVPCGDLTAKFAKNDAKDAKNSLNIYVFSEIVYNFVVHNKKYKTMEITADTPPDKPMCLANRNGGAA